MQHRSPRAQPWAECSNWAFSPPQPYQARCTNVLLIARMPRMLKSKTMQRWNFVGAMILLYLWALLLKLLIVLVYTKIRKTMNIESFFYARLCLMLAKIGTIQADSHSLIDNSKTISSRTTTRKLIASLSLKFTMLSFLLCILFAPNLSAQTNTTSPLPLLEEGGNERTYPRCGG